MYICIARIRKNTSNETLTTGKQVGFRSPSKLHALVQQLDCMHRLLGCSEFQTVGPAETKERQPKVLQRTRGTVS